MFDEHAAKHSRFVDNITRSDREKTRGWNDGPPIGPGPGRARWTRLVDHERERQREARPRLVDVILRVTKATITWNSISIAVAPIFGFFGRVGTNAWYSAALLFMVIVYILSGAYAFQKFETGEAFLNITAQRIYRRRFLEYFTMDPHGGGHNGKFLSQDDWDLLHALSKDRCFKADAKDARTHMWDFWTSMDFCSTILTTIGYGGMVPHTTLGKLTVIVYAIPGMLLMMSYLNLFSMCILILIRKILRVIEKCYQIISCSQARLSSFSVSVILAISSILILVSYLMFMAWRMTSYNPADGFLKCIYFYVITMTTVGLGDIAIIDYTWWGVTVKVLMVFCIGLAAVTTVFGALRGLAEANRKRIIKATKILAGRAKRVDLKVLRGPKSSSSDLNLITET